MRLRGEEDTEKLEAHPEVLFRELSIDASKNREGVVRNRYTFSHKF